MELLAQRYRALSHSFSFSACRALMLSPDCQSVSSRTKLFHSGPSITTITGLVVVKAKHLAFLGSDCENPEFPTGLASHTRTAVGICEKWWETTTSTL